MGGCTSKNGKTEEIKYQRPNTHPRRSIIDNKQADARPEPVSNGKDVIEESNEIHLSGLKIRYAYVTQRGFYPDDDSKPNQDSVVVNTNFGKNPNDAHFAVFDGHGRDGDKCAKFAAKHLPNILARHIHKIKKTVAGASNRIENIELSKEQIHKACTASHRQCNVALHNTQEFEDALSGTTAISAYVQGRRNRVTICNVGDSRAVLGQKVKNEGLDSQDDALDCRFRALPLSRDQTPYRKHEKQRIQSCGARILSLDQIEGLEPVRTDDGNENDFELGEEIDEGGDPPRVWHPTMDYPGTAFTRSLGDSLAEELGVIADPEMLTRELEEGDNIIVLASDGVFEFLTNQSVIDICAKFLQDPLEACRAVINESYELWLQYELRTDDITMICIFIDSINSKQDTVPIASSGESDRPDRIPEEDVILSPSNSDGKIYKRLGEMKKVLAESLKEGPAAISSVDVTNLFTKKTASEKRCILHAFKGSVMLQSLTKEQRNLVLKAMEPVHVKKGDWIIRQGTEGDLFYIVEEGTFEVRISSDIGKDRTGGKVVHKYHGSKELSLHPSFGELALLYSAKRAASVIAITDGKLWSLRRDALKAVVLGHYGRLELVSVLRNVPELLDFSDMEIEDFAGSMTEVEFDAKVNITNEGEEGNALFVISEGKCEIHLDVSDEKLTSTLQRLDFFGQEIMVADNGKYLATVQTLTPTKCWKLEKSTIVKSMKKILAVQEGGGTKIC